MPVTEEEVGGVVLAVAPPNLLLVAAGPALHRVCVVPTVNRGAIVIVPEVHCRAWIQATVAPTVTILGTPIVYSIPYGMRVPRRNLLVCIEILNGVEDKNRFGALASLGMLVGNVVLAGKCIIVWIVSSNQAWSVTLVDNDLVG